MQVGQPLNLGLQLKWSHPRSGLEQARPQPCSGISCPYSLSCRAPGTSGTDWAGETRARGHIFDCFRTPSRRQEVLPVRTQLGCLCWKWGRPGRDTTEGWSTLR